MSSTSPTKRPLNTAVFAGCIVAFLGFGFAATFGVFLAPMSSEQNWGRDVFSLSVAVQALMWGGAQPIAGAIADRYGTARVIAFGAICAGIGFLLLGIITDPVLFILTGVLAGVGTGAASFPIVIGALGKIVTPDRRSFILGLGTAAASLGMFVAAPSATAMIGGIGWQSALILMGCSFALILPCLVFISRLLRLLPPVQVWATFDTPCQQRFLIVAICACFSVSLSADFMWLSFKLICQPMLLISA